MDQKSWFSDFFLFCGGCCSRGLAPPVQGLPATSAVVVAAARLLLLRACGHHGWLAQPRATMGLDAGNACAMVLRNYVLALRTTCVLLSLVDLMMVILTLLSIVIVMMPVGCDLTCRWRWCKQLINANVSAMLIRDNPNHDGLLVRRDVRGTLWCCSSLHTSAAHMLPPR